MDLTKEEILKKAMSKKYCGGTRFNYLDEDETPLIYKAMEKYAEQEAKAYANWLSNQVVSGRTMTKSWKDYRKAYRKINLS